MASFVCEILFRTFAPMGHCIVNLAKTGYGRMFLFCPLSTKGGETMGCKVDSNLVSTNGAIRKHRQKEATFFATFGGIRFWLHFPLFGKCSSLLWSIFLFSLILPPLPLPSPSPSPFSVLFSKNWLLEVYMADGWGNVKYFVAIVLVALSINVASSLQPKSSGGTHKKMFPIDTHCSICRSQLSWNVHPHPISISN